MPHVITGNCLGEVYALCAEECPVDCFHAGTHEGQPLMVIDPDACVDCGACLPRCPVGAIVGSVEDEPRWAKLNAELAPRFKGLPRPAPRSPREPPRTPGRVLVR